MSELIYAISDFMARPAAFIALSVGFTMASIAGFVLPVPDAFPNAVNLTISLVTMIIGQAVLVSSRRDSLATDVKLDRIIEELPGDNDAIGAEAVPAEELEAQKRIIEERAK